MTESPVSVGDTIPAFNVRSLEGSVACYVNLLGCKLDWQQALRFASVSRDRCTIFLCEGDQGRAGTWVWIGVADVEQAMRADPPS